MLTTDTGSSSPYLNIAGHRQSTRLSRPEYCRIYFVDAPETAFRYRERVQAQADYFGITAEQADETGRVAAEFVLTKLSSEPFTIITRWQNYPGRVYAFVRVGGQDLGELLAENGLGRIHGQTVKGLSKPMRDRLAELQEKAKADGRGAWGLR